MSESDIRHVAELARLRLEPRHLEQLARELNGILTHMDVLAAAELAGAEVAPNRVGDASPLRSDRVEAPEALRAHEAFAPLMREGFFLVPRLHTHDGDADA